MSVIVRRLADLDAMRRLGVACGLEDSGREDEHIVAAWGAYDAGALIGCIALERQADLDIVNWMAVDEPHRGRGIAGRLLAELLTEARRRGLGRIWVTARAPGFFRAHGFVELGRGREHDLLLAGCLTCEQYQVTCRPRAFVRDLAAEHEGRDTS